MAGFEFTLVGRGALAIACAQQIIERRLPVRALVSSDAAVLAWAQARGVPCARELQLLAELPASEGAVLLSVSNDSLIVAELLERFQLAINFHDGPLPQYSGSHATSWALMARERHYAITWHRMTARADAGEILLQVPVTIAADETAFSLNGKCHDAALASFPQLLDGIVTGSLAGRPQNPGRRVFYPRDRRPDRLAVLDFRCAAEELDALARALSCGDYPNRLALPKLWTGSAYLVARKVEVQAARSRAAPGTVLRVADDAVEIATVTHDVRLRDLCSLDGEALDAGDLQARFALTEGTHLPIEGEALRQALEAAMPCHWRDEEFWVDRLRELKPWMSPHAASGGATAPIDIQVRGGSPEQVLHRVMCWLGRVSAMEVCDVGLEDSADRGPLVAQVRPYRTGVTLQDWQQRGPYLREAPLRYPRMALPAGWKHHADWPVVIAFTPAPMGRCAAPLRVEIDAHAGRVRLVSGEASMPAAAFAELAGQLHAQAAD